MQCPLCFQEPPGFPPHPLISTTKQKERETSKHQEPRESLARHRPKISGAAHLKGTCTRHGLQHSPGLSGTDYPRPALLHHLFDCHYIGGSVGPLFAVPESL